MNPSTWITVLSILGLLVVISFYVTKSSYHPAYVYGDGNTSASADYLEQKQSKPGKMKQIRILTFGDSLTAGFHNRG